METNLEFRKIKSLKFLYEISEDGRIIRNIKSKKQTQIKIDRDGYPMVYFHFGGRGKNKQTKCVRVHWLVAECWYGDRPDGYQIDHIDNNKLNNHYTNLRYVTQSENMKNRPKDSFYHPPCKVRIVGLGEDIIFDTKKKANYYLAKKYNKSPKGQIQWKLTHKRSHIYDYDIYYLSECND